MQLCVYSMMRQYRRTWTICIKALFSLTPIWCTMYGQKSNIIYAAQVSGRKVTFLMAQEPGQDIKNEEQVAADTNTSQAQAQAATDVGGGETQETQETAFRPLTRAERRNLWLKEYGEQDFALQIWVRLVEQLDLGIEMMLQMHGMLVFGVMVSTAHYAKFYIDLNEETHRENDPDTADTLSEYYTALIPPPNQPEFGMEGLPVVFRYIHMHDVTIMSAGQKVKVSYWRGKVSEVDAFVVGATAGE